MIDYQSVLDRIYAEVNQEPFRGKVATYIPALARVPLQKFGMAIRTIDGREFHVGDAFENFSIQSISKVFTLTLAMGIAADDLWQRVGREPSGNRFNSLIQLEYENGKPRNPFINAGAIVVTDAIFEGVGKTKNNLLRFVRELSNNQTISFDEEVAESERVFGDRNRALANFIRSYGNLKHAADEVLDVYFHQCAIPMSCMDLARAFSYLANKGYSPVANREILNMRQAKRINSLMITCGLYDAVGDFVYRVGLPGKSGVGGGIVAVIPNQLVVTVWSPGLNEAGNSYLGTLALELFTTYASNSIF